MPEKSLIYALPLLALATLGWGDSGPSDAAVNARTSSKPIQRLALNQPRMLGEPGCNATAFAQLPDDRSLFIGRQLVTADGRLAGVSGPNDCSGGDPANEKRGQAFNRWSLTLTKLDWKSGQFSIVKALIDTSTDPRTKRSRAIITGGPMRGLTIRSAYDPSVAKLGDKTYVAFECTVENGQRYHVQQTSSCVSSYDTKRQSIDVQRTVVAVSGNQQGNIYHVAAVPRLLAFKGSLYLYWSAMTVKNGQIMSSVARGAELVDDANGIHLKRAGSRVPTAQDAASIAIWTPDRSAMGNRLVNIMSFAPGTSDFLILAALGGSTCTAPSDKSAGCFRLAVRRSSTPLAHMGFNHAEVVDPGLPTNPQEYALPVQDPQGSTWLMGHFVRPPANGFADRRSLPDKNYWQKTSRASALLMVPAPGLQP